MDAGDHHDRSDNEGDEEEEDDADFDEQQHRSQSEHIVVLIDARTPMHEKQGKKDTQFEMALVATERLMRNAVTKSSGDRFGVIFFGVKKDAEGRDDRSLIPGISLFLELDKPSVRTIMNVQALKASLEDEDDEEEKDAWDDQFGSMTPQELCPLLAALQAANGMFSQRLRNTGDITKIMIFTNDDDPFRGQPADNNDLEMVKQQLRDITRGGVPVAMFGLNSKAHRFDNKKFWDKVLPRDESDDVEDFPQRHHEGGFDSLKELWDEVQVRLVRKRRLARVSFTMWQPDGARSASQEAEDNNDNDEAAAGGGHLGENEQPDVAFGVQVYNMIQPLPRPTTLSVHTPGNKPVLTKVRMLNETTSEYVESYNIRQYTELGGDNKRIYISTEDMKRLKTIAPPGFLLLGFCASGDILRDDYNMRSPYFLYPDEERVRNSSKAFIALNRVMLDKNVVALARFVRAKGAVPQLVAVVPAKEEKDDAGLQISPPGMHVIFLPFAEEVREPPPPADPPAEATEEDMEEMLAIVKKAVLDDFNPQDFFNPALQKYNAKLHAIALSEKMDPPKDTTIPNKEGLDERVGEAVNHFSQRLNLAEELAIALSKKRSGGSGGGSAPKKPKVETDYTKVDWRDVADRRAASDYTLPTMKAFLKSVGKKVSGKKDELADRIYQYFETDG